MNKNMYIYLRTTHDKSLKLEKGVIGNKIICVLYTNNNLFYTLLGTTRYMIQNIDRQWNMCITNFETQNIYSGNNV